MILALTRIRALDGPNRIALIFSVIITALIFAHDQPWPYVFVMALPFMCLWALRPIDALEARPIYRTAAFAVLAIGIAAGFGRNVAALQIGNRDQIALVARAEQLTSPNDVYFDGVGMLPNRPEPSTVWLDRFTILETLRAGRNSEAYRSLLRTPPKVILWSYRLEAIRPLIAPLLGHRYVRIGPNILVAGQRLTGGQRAVFDVPVAGTYALYGPAGEPVPGRIAVDGQVLRTPVDLARGARVILLQTGPATALLLPEHSYRGVVAPRRDNEQLFADVYN
jgi:hypothetical protein